MVDDHPLVRAGLEALLSTVPDVDVDDSVMAALEWQVRDRTQAALRMRGLSAPG